MQYQAKYFVLLTLLVLGRVASAAPESCSLVFAGPHSSALIESIFTRAKAYAEKAGALVSLRTEKDLEGKPRTRVSLDFPVTKQMKLLFRETNGESSPNDIEIARIDIDIQDTRLSLLSATTLGRPVGDSWIVGEKASHSVGLILSYNDETIDAGYARSNFFLGQTATENLKRTLEVAKNLYFAIHPDAQEVVLKTRKVVYKSPKGLPDWFAQE